MIVTCLCHFFHPEIGAPSARILEMAREWREMGHTVKVVTGFPNHPTGVVPPEYRGKLCQKEFTEGIEVYRSYVFARPNAGVLLRTINHLSFMVSSLIFSLPRVGAMDVIIVSSPTFFSVMAAYLFARLKRVPYVFEVRDLWPAILADLGVVRNRFMLGILERLEMFLYKRARKIVTVTNAFRKNIMARGVPGDKIQVISNGADIDFFSPFGGCASDVKCEHSLDGKFVVLYLGAHGISHGLKSIVDCADLLRQETAIHFLLVGEGTEKKTTEKHAKCKGLKNITFVSGQPRSRVPDFYQASDICLVPLRDVGLFDGFIPSKIFEIMAAGRPIVGSLRGEAAEILCRSGGAAVVGPENPEEMACEILNLFREPSRRRAMAKAGRKFVEEHYGRSELAMRYEALLVDLIPKH